MAELIGSPTAQLQETIPSYLYWQYSDDADLQAFVDSYNDIQQGYLDWFNQTPLAVYTSPQISGQLLAWIMQGIYGISQPVFSSLTTKKIAGLNALPLNAVALNGSKFFSSGTATVATDDYYKRVATWWVYIGDGRSFNIQLLRNRVARFLYGVNGTDITLSQNQTVHIFVGTLPLPGPPTLSYVAGGSLPARKYGARQTYIGPNGEGLAGPAASISVPANNLLVVHSPPSTYGATGWNPYATVVSTAPNFKAGLNSNPINAIPINGTNSLATSNPMTLQHTPPLAIGTNWTEPTSGLVLGAPLPTVDNSNLLTNYIITVPTSTASQYFKQAMAQGIIALPFMLSATVVLS